MAELKPGGLALIIDSSKSSDIGKCVTCVRIVPARGSFRSPQGRASVNASDHLSWLVSGDVVASTGKETPVGAGNGWALYPPQYLLPIDGDDFQHKDERQKELIDG